MKRKFGNLLMAATLVLAVGSFFSSCRDYDEELAAQVDSQKETIEQLNEQLASDKAELESAVDEALTEVGGEIDDLGDEIAELKARIDSLAGLDHGSCDCPSYPVCDHTKQDLADSIAAVRNELDAAIRELADKVATKDALKEVSDSLAALKGDFESHVVLFNTLSGKVDDALTRLSLVEGQYADLDTRVKAIENAKYQEQIDVIKGELADVLTLATAADALSKRDSVRIDALEAFDVEISQALKDSIAAVRAEAVANLQAAKDYADAAVKVVADELAATNATIAELQNTYKLAIAELQDQIDVLQERLDGLVEDVTAVSQRVDKLVEVIDSVKERMDNQITSVVLNGAYSPVVGYFNLPTGVKSNILAAYYGEANDFHFPTTRTSYNVVGSAAFTDADFALLGIQEAKQNGGVLVADGANAGKVYMTINPAEVSLEGKEFALVNSRGEESPAKITNIKKSDDKLAFGYTRGEAVPLYEAEARIEAADVEGAKIRIELSDLKDALKDVVTVKDGVNVTDVVTTLYAVVNDVADAHAVHATWADADGASHTVYSDFSLASVAVKPLGYNFLADLNVQSIPGYHRGMNLINKVFDKVGTINIPDLGISELKAPEINSIKLEGKDGDSIEFKVSFTTTIPYTFETKVKVDIDFTDSLHLSDEYIKIEQPDGSVLEGTIKEHWIHFAEHVDVVVGEDGYVNIREELELPVKVTNAPVKVASKDVLDSMSGSFDDINSVLASLDSFLDEVNAIIADFNGKIEKAEDVLNATKDKVQSGLNKYLSKLNNKLCSMINSFNAALQPTMLVSTTDGFTMLSSIKAAPTTIDKASAVLVPTSFTAETLAPAYKKYVAVTKAYDANGNAVDAVAKAANTGDLNTVLEGGVRTVQFNGQSGYTYEITYSAADYYGMISTTKYYVRVK